MQYYTQVLIKTIKEAMKLIKVYLKGNSAKIRDIRDQVKTITCYYNYTRLASEEMTNYLITT